MRKIALLFALIVLPFFLVNAQVNKKLQNKIIKLSKSNVLQHGQWSVYAEYVKNGEKIISLNSEKGLAPASGLKVFSTSTALNLLGENYQYKTRIYYDGIINSAGTLKGNIYILGGGDPTLGSNQVQGSLPLDSLMMNWTSAIKAKGIKKIDGAVISVSAFFSGNRIPGFWNWMDIGNYYGAGPSSLTINDDLYYLYFKPAEKVGDLTTVLKTEPEIPGLTFDNHVKTGKPGSGDNGYIYCAPNQFNATLRGTIPAGVNEFYIKGSIPNPPLFAAQYLKKYLSKSGIESNGKAEVINHQMNLNNSNLITTTYSPPLKDIVYITNKKSNNLYAQTILQTLGKEKAGIGSNRKGIKVLMNFLDSVSVNTSGVKLYDGCGLSRTDMITTKAMVQLLAFMTKQKVFKAFYNSLAVAGLADDPGFFKHYGTNTIIAKNARIKSGLITNVRSESGYLRDRKGRLIAFSMISNNSKGNTKQIDNLHKKIMIYLAELN